MVKNVFICVAKQRILDPTGTFSILRVGTDSLEGLFGEIRTLIGSDRNVDIGRLIEFRWLLILQRLSTDIPIGKGVVGVRPQPIAELTTTSAKVHGQVTSALPTSACPTAGFEVARKLKRRYGLMGSTKTLYIAPELDSI